MSFPFCATFCIKYNFYQFLKKKGENEGTRRERSSFVLWVNVKEFIMDKVSLERIKWIFLYFTKAWNFWPLICDLRYLKTVNQC